MKEEKDGIELLRLLRIQRSYTYPTLEGRKVLIVFRPVYNRLQDHIEYLMKTIGGRAKTRIRKECKERACPNFKLEGINKAKIN